MKLHIISGSASKKMGHGKEYIENIVNRIYDFNKKEDLFDNIILYTFNLAENINLNSNISLKEVSFKSVKDKNYYLTKYNKYLWRVFYGVNRIKNYYTLYNLVLHNYKKDDEIYFTDYEYISMFLKRNIFKKNPILTLHTMDFNKNEYSFIESIYKKTSKLFNRVIFESSKKVLVHGKYIKKSFIEVYPENKKKVRVVDYGISENTNKVQKNNSFDHINNKYNLKLNNYKINLLIFGMLRQNKGIVNFLNKFISLANFNNFNLLIVGKNYDIDEKDIQNIIKNKQNIEWINEYVPSNEIKYFFGASDFLVLPYLKNMNSQSGPLKLAMGYNTPVISSKYGELGFFTKEYGVGETFDPYDYNSVKSVFSKISKDINNYKLNIQKIQKSMSWENMATKIWEVIKE
ncbi:glycosyltransferase involved in cell wall biosynthesis [Halanaerobium saccharolyticum]|uniref:Glycosyltransferase involved in cell wall biosynthesis n=1 Tax=Halanaerobium saccharolyticum TaxID=43595 RepID=A0A4R6R6K0_9FIRM|nr:glycosyltransferase [Halanaerobium saccharolyticum]TDP81570.1 glycosyltransferase involved in cell wall biosynthesis [Halanaerobium saccharolyticum]